MLFFYNLFLILSLILFFPVLAVLFTFDSFRFRERTGLVDPDALDSRRSILIHGASLGEMTIVQKILPGIQRKYPGMPIIVSSTTVSGRNHILKNAADFISHAIAFPLEFPFSVRRMIRMANPAIIVITETELWPNFLRYAKLSGARLVLINGRLSDKSWTTYRFFRFFFKPALCNFDAIGVQNELFRDRFVALGVPPERVTVTGNVKESLDQAVVSPEERTALREKLGLFSADKLLIAASTRPGEEELVLRAYQRLCGQVPEARLVLAPRHLSRLSEVEAIVKAAGVPYALKTQLKGKGSGRPVILLDTLGELSGLFAAADAAFVGGSLTDFGGHNLLEPLPHFVPVAFGPFISAQKGSADLILDHACGSQVASAEELAEFVIKIFTQPLYQKNLEEGIRRLINRSGRSLNANLALI